MLTVALSALAGHKPAVKPLPETVNLLSQLPGIVLGPLNQAALPFLQLHRVYLLQHRLHLLRRQAQQHPADLLGITLQFQHEFLQIPHHLVLVGQKLGGLQNMPCMGGVEIPQIVLIPVGQLAEVPLQLIPQLVQRAGIRPGPLRHPFQRVQNPLEQLGGEDRRAQIEIFQGNGHPLDLGGRLGHGIAELLVFVFGNAGGTVGVLDGHQIPPTAQRVQVLFQLFRRIFRKMTVRPQQRQQFRLVQPDMGLLGFQIEGPHDGPVAPGVLRREIAGFRHTVQCNGVKLHRLTSLPWQQGFFFW